ncbi:hypothetical protein CFC21_027489 [Triticum aestivum]|uniref:Uncharacterized protein n=2 Tax=Triticum aestivum TaxID=4565 RepID=A0A3B6D8P5_WHEAT|nr:hypothetical protein CFC21_027489 [Triticum aestivum]
MKSNITMVVNGGSEMDALFLLRRQQELLTQVRAHILPALRDADGKSADLAIVLFDDVIECIAGVMSRLQGISTQADGHGAVTAPFELADVLVISHNAGEGQDEKPVISNVGQKRRRNNEKRLRSLDLLQIAYTERIAQQPRQFSNMISMELLIVKRKLRRSLTEFQKFEQGDVDVPTLIKVLDNPELNWNIIC